MAELGNRKNKLLAEQVQELLLTYILETPCRIGEKLPNEFELAERFGVGRSTIREAVKNLASRGVLEVRRGSGTYVVSTTPADQDPLGLQGVEDKLALALDLAEVRLLLEPGIAEMAARNAGREQILKLEQICDQVERRILDGENYVETDIAFHTCIAECSGNLVVGQLIPIIDTAVMMFVNVTHRKLTQETIMTHRAVTEAIAEHDPIGAKTAMMMHLTFNRNAIKELEKEQRLPYLEGRRKKKPDMR